MSNPGWDQLQTATKGLQSHLTETPEIGIILGSGLSQTFSSLEDKQKFLWQDLPNFPKTSVEGHLGEWHFGRRKDKKLLVQRGRVHYYEGHSMSQLLLPIRVMKLLGIKTLILTGAVGAINKNFSVGDIVLVEDHINCIPESPLRGPNIEQLGPRFPDLTELYSPGLRKITKAAAKKLKIKMQEGIYVATPGPMFETPAEIQGYRTLGGDVVGMSLAPEAIAARHAGMDILALSIVTNMAAGVIKNVALDHKDVLKITHTLAPDLEKLIDQILVML